jgi:hypothetical protein
VAGSLGLAAGEPLPTDVAAPGVEAAGRESDVGEQPSIANPRINMVVHPFSVMV